MPTSKTARERPKLPTDHMPMERPFQRISVALVEYQSISTLAEGVRCKYVLSSMDHLNYGPFHVFYDASTRAE